MIASVAVDVRGPRIFVSSYSRTEDGIYIVNGWVELSV